MKWLHSVTLLYVVFAAALLHLGYFLMNKQTESLVLFTLVCVFTYLNTKNMIVVLTATMLFVDALYLVRKIPEGFDVSGSDASYNLDGYTDVSLNELSNEPLNELLLNDISLNELSNEVLSNEVMSNELSNELSNDVLLNQAPIRDVPIRDAPMSEVNKTETKPSLIGNVKNKEPTRYLENAVKQMFKKKEAMTGDIAEVDSQSKEMTSVIEKIKNSTPEMMDSMKMLNSIDIHELNKLINNLNKIVNTVSE